MTNATPDIDRQMQQVNVTLWKLNAYWKATEASKQLQLLIFDAVMKSKLLYGMDCSTNRSYDEKDRCVPNERPEKDFRQKEHILGQGGH